MISIVRRYMLHRYDPKPDTWVGDWLKGIIGGGFLKRDKKDTEVDSAESDQEGEKEENSESAKESDTSSDDNNGGLRIPIPD